MNGCEEGGRGKVQPKGMLFCLGVQGLGYG